MLSTIAMRWLRANACVQTVACLRMSCDRDERSRTINVYRDLGHGRTTHETCPSRAKLRLQSEATVARSSYSVIAEDMAEAVQKFHGSAQAALDILFVIKTETEIYLAQ